MSRAGKPNKDKIELRARVQEAVLEFTRLRQPESVKEREAAQAEYDKIVKQNDVLVAQGQPPQPLPEVPPAQEIEEEYDPVVALALAAVDVRNTVNIRVRCHSEAAQYLRPKLKSIEVKEDPTAIKNKQEAVTSMITLLDQLAEKKANEYSQSTTN